MQSVSVHWNLPWASSTLGDDMSPLVPSLINLMVYLDVKHHVYYHLLSDKLIKVK